MFQTHVPEKIIQERTGHRSLAAMRTYECTTAEPHKAVSAILSSSSHHSYEQTVQNFHQSKLHLIFQPNTSHALGMHLSFQNLTGRTVNVYQTPANMPGPVQPRDTVLPPCNSPFSNLDLEVFIKDLDSDM